MAFTDDFTDTNNTILESHTPSGGTAWTLVGSKGDIFAKISSNLCFSSSGGPGSGGSSYSCDDQGSADHYTQYINKFFEFITNSPLRACSRFVDASNYFSHRIVGTGAGGSRLGKTVAGVDTDLVLVQGALDDINKITVTGNNWEFFIGGVSQGTAIDAAFNTETTQALFVDATNKSFADYFEAGANAAPPSGGAGILSQGFSLTLN